MRLEQLITGNDEVQQHLATERDKQALVAVSPMARKAIRLEILPQIEESVISLETAEELGHETKRAIEAAFSYKNQLYTRLVSHKGIEQGDGQFLADLLLVMDEWLRKTEARLEQDSKSQPEAHEPAMDKQEVEVTVKVEQEDPSNEILLKNTDDGPKIEIDPAALVELAEFFDLGDVRL